MPGTSAQIRCVATVKIHDDHWGAFTNQCELLANHQGDHRYSMTACEPLAYIGWPNPPLGNDGDV